MKLLALGTSGYHPNDQRQTACLMLPELGIVLDAGTAMYRVRDHLITDDLDIFVTHPHLDHVIGLTYLFDVLWEKQMHRVSVHADATTHSAITDHLFAPVVFPVKPPFESKTLDGQVALRGGGQLTPFPLAHPGGSLGFRLDWPDRSMAYVTDTTATADADYIEAIRGVDLLVHECYFTDAMPRQAALTGHSCTTPVAEIAKRADVGRLLLTHINPLAEAEDPIDLDVARAIFPETYLGFDGMEIEF